MKAKAGWPHRGKTHRSLFVAAAPPAPAYPVAFVSAPLPAPAPASVLVWAPPIQVQAPAPPAASPFAPIAQSDSPRITSEARERLVGSLHRFHDEVGPFVDPQAHESYLSARASDLYSQALGLAPGALRDSERRDIDAIVQSLARQNASAGLLPAPLEPARSTPPANTGPVATPFVYPVVPTVLVPIPVQARPFRFFRR
jgi:hypothetical protein